MVIFFPTVSSTFSAFPLLSSFLSAFFYSERFFISILNISETSFAGSGCRSNFFILAPIALNRDPKPYIQIDAKDMTV